MSDLPNEILNTNPIPLHRKPKGKPETSDLDLRERNDNYNRKNAILWTVSICSIIVIISLMGLFVYTICTNKDLQLMLVQKMVENIVVIVTFICALFGIQASINKN